MAQIRVYGKLAPVAPLLLRYWLGRSNILENYSKAVIFLKILTKWRFLSLKSSPNAQTQKAFSRIFGAILHIFPILTFNFLIRHFYKFSIQIFMFICAQNINENVNTN